MRVKDYFSVVGKGWVLICDENDVRLHDKIDKDGTEFEIIGIERITSINLVGLILSPNNKVPYFFEVDDEIIVKD